jgi:hypothetical protein
MSRRKISTTVYLEPTQYLGIKKLAQESGQTDAGLIRLAIDDILERHALFTPVSLFALAGRLKNREKKAKQASHVMTKKLISYMEKKKKLED